MFLRLQCRRFSFTYPVPKSLREVAKVQLLQQRDPETIKQLWNAQFAEKREVVTTSMSVKAYETLSFNSKSAPMFILPVKRGSGSYFNAILQFASKSVLYTSVDSFKAKGLPNSEPYFILTFFDELAHRDVVLVRGDVINTRDVSKENARALMDNTIMFYTDFNLFQWVKTFNKRPQEFDYEEFKRKCSKLFV
ncbi:conserved hypothetical protein [Theileria equi strain WA]|uniref:ATP synthase mitochondrial F1 complex assembly factor 1 n=1 Tax=Theileria equi strain WA TaxID=1537102 RepID=L1LDZ6_THEEQ|nr:conserved hypothetical protein [Theileria equi strain WA]EKX73504.1 conserved hypothetical protein [Theileria equi strain WA]|eukprot:XP_004832956.1 conserved hypothetical protein [Theileria equi strain WA]